MSRVILLFQLVIIGQCLFTDDYVSDGLRSSNCGYSSVITFNGFRQCDEEGDWKNIPSFERLTALDATLNA